MSSPLSGRVDFGPARLQIRWGSRFSIVANTRVAAVTVVCLVVCLVAFLVSVVTGPYPVSTGELIDIVSRQGKPFPTKVVLEWRLPRAVAAVVFGAALGVSGAVFQSLTRNPLGSPDVIGFNTGAFTGALISIVFLSGSALTTITFAFIGGIATAVAVYLLAYRSGVDGFRFVLVGVGVSAALSAVNSLIVLKADTRVALTASIWGQGSLENLRWAQAAPSTLLLAAMIPATMAIGRHLRQLELGDDHARGTGARIEPTRLASVVAGIGLIALVTSVCGPVAFLALAAPQLARVLTASAGTNLIASAAVGGALLIIADLVAGRVFPSPVPVGIVTVVIGGSYLTWLLTRRIRIRTS
ncbi:FecCD family ABC transporter permease [Micromonospora craniellae]|uniref:Iron-enterobactin ABC transporter permease n=1 Tax=Micromonospora craniellae TaxID=2294034 RepID=A0A372FYN2_9ACTN|nr:iron chelate uptake ABC transporter family permease subunit [Micromonospora craniellae]QOC93448.1 iron chelate uptake ABC transporter family permease subunit [Micromonospora craniellae]RFS45895.1 iron-enterobactin ABC transporter permease [Micromonospora craniellae]